MGNVQNWHHVLYDGGGRCRCCRLHGGGGGDGGGLRGNTILGMYVYIIYGPSPFDVPPISYRLIKPETKTEIIEE